jgi:hypothetical protein
MLVAITSWSFFVLAVKKFPTKVPKSSRKFAESYLFHKTVTLICGSSVRSWPLSLNSPAFWQGQRTVPTSPHSTFISAKIHILIMLMSPQTSGWTLSRLHYNYCVPELLNPSPPPHHVAYCTSLSWQLCLICPCRSSLLPRSSYRHVPRPCYNLTYSGSAGSPRPLSAFIFPPV